MKGASKEQTKWKQPPEADSRDRLKLLCRENEHPVRKEKGLKDEIWFPLVLLADLKRVRCAAAPSLNREVLESSYEDPINDWRRF